MVQGGERWGRGEGIGGVCREISEKTGNFNMVLCLVQWENKILVYGLHKNNPMHTTMPNSPVEFLRECNLTQFPGFSSPLQLRRNKKPHKINTSRSFYPTQMLLAHPNGIMSRNRDTPFRT